MKSTATTGLAQAKSWWDIGVEQYTDARSALTEDLACDVVIVGGGFTGLWTAYYLAEHAPALSVVVLEAEHVGYGASGRNGGWLSHLMPGEAAIYEKGSYGLDGVIRLQRALINAVDEVLDIAEKNNISIDAKKGGAVTVAANEAGMQRLRARLARDRRNGMADEETRMLSASELHQIIDAATTVGGYFSATVARMHPGKLVRQLARVVESRRVRILENSRVETLEPRLVTTDKATVTAEHVLLCTEGFSGPLLGNRTLIPIRSSMIATQSLTAEQWDTIGWANGQCLNDTAHAFIYAQRTASDRIAIGGRGKPYNFGSSIDETHSCHPQTQRQLLDRLAKYFPGIEWRAEYAWSGVLGVSRDWCASVHHDRATGVGYSVGYVGHGVTAAKVAGQTLADLVLERDTDFTHLPFVDHRLPRWEPEPIRWTGITTMYRLFRAADAQEERTRAQRTSLVARFARHLAGMH